MLEAAIPPHLTQDRTLPVNTPPNYEPPFPAYTARYPREIKAILMAIIGAQHVHRPERGSVGSAALDKLRAFVETDSSASKPIYWEPASVTDNTGAYNETVIAYWPDKSSYSKWAAESGFESWWQSLDPTTEPNGWFRELLLPPLDRFETVFSDDAAIEGVAHMRNGVSGPLREHVYWGSMRDRLPAAQTDQLVGMESKTGTEPSTPANDQDTSNRRVKVPGRQNLAIIRSGQDWSQTTPRERKLYLETMHPVLIKGMDFLRDHGAEVGCFDCRFMDTLNSSSLQQDTDKTFGLAYFDDLASLEGWSKSHKTHLDIFGRFLQYAKELEGNLSLKLFHEVLVLEADQQEFEYVGCHAGTGMLVRR